jgi:hypothetical protein
MNPLRILFALAAVLAGATAVSAVLADDKEAPLNTPPRGFTLLFNGKDLTGWQSVITMAERQKLTREQIEKKLEADNKKNLPHWTVKDGVLTYDGKSNSLQTAKDYGNFELLIDWKIAEKGDSGIYLRGQPQVQIWDSDRTPGARGVDKSSGSGGLWNNPLPDEAKKLKEPQDIIKAAQKVGKMPLKKADKPVGEWNAFRIIVKDDKVTVYLNGTLVVDKGPLLNYWERGKPVPKKGPIELQHHGDPLWFRNIYIKELPDDEK